jgi:hypothetical protein
MVLLQQHLRILESNMDHNDITKTLEMLALDLPRCGGALHMGWDGARGAWWARAGEDMAAVHGATIAEALAAVVHGLRGE